MTKPSAQPGPADHYRSEPVAVIGLSCLFPGAPHLAAYWANLKASLDAIGDVPKDHWSAEDYYDPDPKAEDKTYGRRGGFLAPVPFEPLKYGIVPNDLSAIDTTQLLGLVAADQALADAGYGAGGACDHSRTAVILGVTGALKMVVSLGSRLAHPQLRRALEDSGADGDLIAEVLRRFAGEFTPWQENSFPGLLGNVTAGRIANRLNLGGANLVVDAACASSLAAVRQGLTELRSGQADLVVTGGMDTFSDPFMYTCFSKTPALSPTGDVLAYDQDGDGTMLGEGLGVVVLKRLADARRDGDRVYAVIRAMGASSDGKGAAIFAPTVCGQSRALANAYAEAGFDPGQVGLVEGHGTGTAVGDAVEAEALAQVFGRSGRADSGRPWCSLGSVKSQIGHTKAAAGAAGLIKAALALYFKTLPPAVKVRTPLPVLTRPGSPFHLSSRPRPWLGAGPRRAGVSAFGFGGSNFHCLLEEADPAKPGAEAPVDFELFAFSGPDPDAIVKRLIETTRAHDPARAAAQSREDFSADDACRLVAAVSGPRLAALAAELTALMKRPDAAPGDWPAEVFYGAGPALAGGFGVLSSPARAVRPDQFRDLAVNWPEMLEALSQAAAELAQAAPDLSPLDLILYPPDLASPENRTLWARESRDPRFQKVVRAAFHRGLTEILEKFGLRPEVALDADAKDFDLEKGLAKHSKIGRWIEPGPGRTLARAAFEAGRQALAMVEDEDESDGHPALARLLGRLAALGLPVDFRAWPRPFLAAPAGPDPEKTFTVLISGANYFVRKELPPSPRRAATGQPDLAALERLTRETARLHQEFLDRQTEALRLLQGAPAAPPAPAPRPEPAPAFVVAASAPAVALVAVPAPAPTAPTTRPAPVAGAGEALVLEVVSAETGYPVEMLSLDMGLEADLGLDSIKKVEIMAALGERRPALQELNPEALGRAAALRDLVALADAVSPDGPPAPAPAAEHAAAPAAPTPAESPLWEVLVEVVAAETGYPREMLTPGLRLGEDLGLDSIKLVEIASSLGERRPEAAALSADTLGGARTLDDLARALAGAAVAVPGPAPAAPATAGDSVVEIVFEVVSHETGYPKTMLNLNMNLEADLGLDSIKRVEILAALGERLPLDQADAGDALAGLLTLGDLAALAGGAPGRTAPAMAPAAGPDPGAVLLEAVARETGYPQDMLSFSAALEADLGLDSIKRVEILAALGERLGEEVLTAVPTDVLSGAVTLGDLRDLLTSGRPPAAARPVPAPVPAAAAPASPPAEPSAAEARKRGPGRPPKNSPPAFKAAPDEPEMALTTAGTTPFRVDLAPLAQPFGPPRPWRRNGQTIIVADPGPLADEMEKILAGRGLAVERLDWRAADEFAPRPGLEAAILAWPGPDRGDPDLPRRAFRLARAVGAAISGAAMPDSERAPLLMGLTRLGGSLGLAEGEVPRPESAALAGLLKTAAREWPQARVRVVDLPEAAFAAEAAAFAPALAALAEAAEAPAELALPAPDQFLAPRLSPYKLKNIRVRHIREGQTILVTGGARGVTAAALKEIARPVSPNLVILGRTPLPSSEPRWLENLKDEAAIRQALFNRAKVKPGPLELARESRRILAGREVRNNLQALEKAGARVTYRAGDFRDPETLKAVLAEIRKSHGPIHGFIHGAGVLADGLITDKKDENFDLVFDTKARLAELILGELASEPLNLVAFFSSSTARFGRRGQADYAAANEVLNKLARAQAGTRQGPKCLSVNWGPWDGGMVDAGLKRLFEDEGVGLIPLDEGARLFATLAGTPKNDPVEVVVLGPDTDLSALMR